MKEPNEIFFTHVPVSMPAILSVFTMLCINLEWLVIAPRGSFLFSEKSAWFSKNTAANSDDFNMCIRVLYSTQA